MRKIIRKIYGRKRLQKFFEKLYLFSLYGMNIGRGGEISEDGELFVLEYVRDRIQSEKITIFDVGANIGFYLKKLIYYFPYANIYAFEPSRETFNKLSSEFHGKNVNLLNKGFGDREDEMILYSNSNSSGLASLYNRRLDHFNIKMKKKEKVKITTIDRFTKKNNIERIDFLKMDIEGNEFNALKGALENIKNKKIGFIQFEFGGCNIDSRTYFQDYWYLLKDNYKIYRIMRDGLYKINKYKETYECFLTTNYLAELK